ncbi:MAG: H-X9-DG-CTERM domain-containing protein [Isosphaeraceae bacterium]
MHGTDGRGERDELQHPALRPKWRRYASEYYYTPNSTTYDCLRGPDFGWRTARSRHPGGVNAVFVDGSVHFVKNTVSLATYRALATIAGGEVISSDAY